VLSIAMLYVAHASAHEDETAARPRFLFILFFCYQLQGWCRVLSYIIGDWPCIHDQCRVVMSLPLGAL